MHADASERISSRPTLRNVLASLLLAALLALQLGCSAKAPEQGEDAAGSERQAIEQTAQSADEPPRADAGQSQPEPAKAFSLDAVGDWAGEPSVQVDGNIPYFTADEIAYAEQNPGCQSYSDLDSLGRCGAAQVCAGPETMPGAGEERGSIGMVKPSGWHAVKYDSVEGRYLYNRCHLAAWCLTGQNANEKNLVTGTRYMNVDGMLPYETDTAQYIERTGNHVLYRVTPVFQGDELVCRGVLMEARSVEDGGAGLQFAVWCWNAQPGICIDYATGDSSQMQALPAAGESSASQSEEPQASAADAAADGFQEKAKAYVLNTKSKKFHDPGCPSVSKMSDKNREDVEATRGDLIAQGYSPCGNCNP